MKDLFKKNCENKLENGDDSNSRECDVNVKTPKYPS